VLTARLRVKVTGSRVKVLSGSSQLTHVCLIGGASFVLGLVLNTFAVLPCAVHRLPDAC
jgi:hypothetical protein